MLRFLLLLFLAPASAQAVDSRIVDRPLDRLQHKIEDARNSGKISASQYDGLRSSLENIKLMREEALAGGPLSAAGKDTLLKAIRSAEVDLAEAKTAPKSAGVAAQESASEEPDIPALTGNPVPREPGRSGSAQ